MTVNIETLTGIPSPEALESLSALRLTVFREWPYLYDGDPGYEADYLRTFAAARDGIIVYAYDDDQIVGAATAAPLAAHTNAFVPLFEAHGYDPKSVFYFGESVLLPPYRGQGIGHAFFNHREAHVQALNAAGGNYRYIAFCGVVRPNNDPRRPVDFRPLDAFWQKRRYEPVAGMVGNYDWRELGCDEETPHPMQFWFKPL